MSTDVKSYGVFIASPGGLAEERRAFRNALNECNERDAFQRKLMFRAIGWEDTLAGLGRPQTLINSDIERCDYFLLVLWDRWGTPPGGKVDYTSGTEEEFSLACALLADAAKPMQQVVILFKGVNEKQLSDPGTQLQKVLDFKKKLEAEKSFLFGTFDTIDEFEKLLRKFLSQWIYDHETAPNRKAQLAGGLVLPVLPRVTANAAETSTSMRGSQDLALAEGLAEKGEITEAEKAFARVVVRQENAGAFLRYARFLSRVGRIDHAQKYYRNALTLAERGKDELSMARAMSGLASVAEVRGEFSLAESLLESSIELNEKTKDQRALANDYADLAWIFRERGEFARAEELLLRAGPLFKALHNRAGEAKVEVTIGVIALMKGDATKAKESIERSLHIYEEIKDEDGIAVACGNLGNVFMVIGDLEKAEKMHRRALKSAKKFGDQQRLASAYGSLGHVYFDRRDFDQAEKMYYSALRVEEKLGRQAGLATAYSALAAVFRAKGDLAEAEKLLRKAISIEDNLGRRTALARNSHSLATIAIEKKDMAEARTWADMAIENYAAVGDVEHVKTVQQLLSSISQSP